jgi:hypothetical protein
MTSTTIRFPYSVEVVNTGAVSLEIYNPDKDSYFKTGGTTVTAIDVYEGDYGYDLQFTALDVNGLPLNLEGGSVDFIMYDPDSDDIVFDGECAITDATAGKFVYTTDTTDFSSAGIYLAQVVIEVAGKVITIGGIKVYVLRKYNPEVLV